MTMRGRNEIRVSGFGGQGVILMGKILGTAAAIEHKRHATLIQTYGPETRGSACRVDLLINDDPIDYPYINKPQLLLVLSQDAYNKFRRTLKPGGIMLYDEDLVQLDEADRKIAAGETSGTERPTRLCPVPAMRLAEEAGGRIMTNIAMLGFCVALTEVIGREELQTVVADMVPKAMTAANLDAVRRGYEYGLEWMKTNAWSSLEALAV